MFEDIVFDGKVITHFVVQALCFIVFDPVTLKQKTDIERVRPESDAAIVVDVVVGDVDILRIPELATA